MQYGELRSYRGSRLVKFFLWIFINIKDTYETGESFFILFNFVFFTMGLTMTPLQCKCQLWLMRDRGDLILTKPTKIEKQIKRNPRRNRATRCILRHRNGCKNPGKIWWTTKLQYTETLKQVSLMKHLQRPYSRDVRIWVRSVIILISLKTEIPRSVNGPKLQGPHAEDAMAVPYLVLKNLVT